MALNPKALALTLGTFAAVAHLIWAVIILAGGQSFILWMIKAHGLSGVSLVAGFGIVDAVLGIVAAAIIASIFGYILATIWNFVSEKV